MFQMHYFNKSCRKLLCFLLCTALTAGLLIVPAAADNNMELNCKAALLMDAGTGTVLYEKNAHEKLPPASVTKVMTMLLIMEAIDSGKITLDDKVTISSQADSKHNKGTMLLLDAGEVRLVKELLTGIAVESANDACIAMGEYISGSAEEFVKLMNKRAKELGMNDTNFININGLHIEGHATSAYDVAVMSRELVKHEKIFDFISQYMVTVYVGKNNNIKRELVNKNKMVRFFNDVDGIKTGYTTEAKYCISVSAKRNNMRLISVILGAPDINTRTREARKLIDYGFANYNSLVIAKKGDTIKEVPVSKGNTDTVKAITNENITALVSKGDEKSIKKVVNVPEKLRAPLKKGEKIGELIVYKGDKEIGKYPLVCDRDVTGSTFFNNLQRAFDFWFGK